MPTNSLSPAFVRIEYTSAYGIHSMTIPAVPVIPNFNVGGDYGFDLRGANIDVPVQSAVEDFVDTIAALCPTTTVFQAYTLFTQANEDAKPVPVESRALNKLGLYNGAGWAKAVQMTMTFRTELFGQYKLVLLDCTSLNDFNRVSVLANGTTLKSIADYVTSSSTWIAGRDGGRPATFLQAAFTLNEKLRRSYRMN